MCIRDRVCRPLGSVALGSVALGSVAVGTVVVGCLATGSVAVSYTHLRAHETVLEIVCRLLLEKQNNFLSPTLPLCDAAADSIFAVTTSQLYKQYD